MNTLLQPLPALLWNMFFCVICLQEAYDCYKKRQWVFVTFYVCLIVLWLLTTIGIFAKLPLDRGL